MILGCERLTSAQSLLKKLVPRGILILFLDIVSLFVEKSHRSPSDLETCIAHRCLKPKDTVTLGFVGHKSNLTGRERFTPQSKNFFSD